MWYSVYTRSCGAGERRAKPRTRIVASAWHYVPVYCFFYLVETALLDDNTVFDETVWNRINR